MRYVTTLALCLAAPFAAFADPLPSWNPTATEAAIIDFVGRVTDPGSADFMHKQDRIAVFDNAGTLWSEQPMYFQGLFALDRLREKAAANPAILDSEALRAANAGLPVEAFKAKAHDWLTTARRPTAGLPYAQMTYRPMLELLVYLRYEGFRTYIVSGGGVDFMRSVGAETYGVPPWQVIGSEGASTTRRAGPASGPARHDGARPARRGVAARGHAGDAADPGRELHDGLRPPLRRRRPTGCGSPPS